MVDTPKKPGPVAGKVFIVVAPFAAAIHAQATALLREGAHIVVVGEEHDHPTRLAAGLASGAGAICADVASERGWWKAFRETLERFGRIDGVLNPGKVYDPSCEASRDACDHRRLSKPAHL